MAYPIEKECPICGKSFLIENFANAKRKYCYTCSPEGRKGDYTPLIHAMKRRVIQLKGGKCQRCGYNKYEDALCFHHRNPKEKEMVLAAKSGSCNWEKFLAEAEKCDLLCLNCHAEVHEELRR